MQGIDLTLNMINTIAQGTTDVHVIADEDDSTSATVQATNSNYSSTSVVGPAASIVDNGGNQTTEPTFVDPAADFHQTAESVTVDAGQAREPGALDNEYEARDQGGVDIGADELDGISPNISLDQGPSGGATTNDSAPTWTFSSEDLTADFVCRFRYNEWSDWSPCDTGTPGQGSYTVNPAVPNSNDDLALEVQSTDLNGWTDTEMYTYDYVDNTAPVVSILSQPSAVINKGQTASFTFSSDDASATLDCRLATSGEETPAWNDCSSGQFTSGALVIGDYTFEVKSTDQDLNTGTATDSFQVRDLVAPGTSFTRTPRRISYDRTPVFGFSSNDSKATFQCKMDANRGKACASPRQYLPGAGWHTFKVRAVDPHQNVDATPASRRFKIERRRS
jgi:large repetitive protein